MFAIGYEEKPYQICKADSGAIRFKIVRCSSQAVFIFMTKECPHEPLYHVTLSENATLYDIRNNIKNIDFKIPHFYQQLPQEFWVTWYNNVIRMGRLNEPPMLEYSEVNNNKHKQIIGFIKFKSTNYVYDDDIADVLEWSFESTPYVPMSIQIPKKVSGGKLHWVKMRTGDLLPIDAMIAGFEEEPLYIARAKHRSSLCPGKYVKSEQVAFIPWGHLEFAKNEFEILCGYDAIWVKCRQDKIPENAFIGGTSEVHNEPLFIGRAMIDNNLINGKVHMMYKTCYLPYKGREVEVYTYEILVTTHVEPRGVSCDPLCHMKMIMSPCI